MSLLLHLPSDLLTLITRHLTPTDLLSLSFASRLLHLSVTSSDKIWLAQCLSLLPNPSLLATWRSASPSYFLLFRFLYSIYPLLGLWVHQNPELGNVVNVMYGSGSDASVVACRVIPQEISNCLLWAPVFKIVPASDGKGMLFFLYGDDEDDCCVFPGIVQNFVPKDCNVLLLEVACGDKEEGQFGKLAFGDRRRLLDCVASKVKVVNNDLSNFLEEKTSKLYEIHTGSGNGRVNWRKADTLETIERSRARNSISNGKKTSLFSMVRYIIGRSNSGSSLSTNSSESNRHLHLTDFLKGGDNVGLSLRATNMRLTSYRAWPNMHDNRFALYKLTMQEPVNGKEYAGLWGGSFGWPPNKASIDKSGKALFFIVISYEEIEGSLVMIGTKILEGNHYVLHPNGSAMFTVRVNEPALDSFPWEKYGDDVRVDVKESYAGEGIANGYGFRYPGSKPGSLFEMRNGELAFVWKESKAVLVLKRLHLEDMLRKGERVPALPPIANFAYLTKSYSNVFTAVPASSGGCSSSSDFDEDER